MFSFHWIAANFQALKIKNIWNNRVIERSWVAEYSGLPAGGPIIHRDLQQNPACWQSAANTFSVHCPQYLPWTGSCPVFGCVFNARHLEKFFHRIFRHCWLVFLDGHHHTMMDVLCARFVLLIDILLLSFFCGFFLKGYLYSTPTSYTPVSLAFVLLLWSTRRKLSWPDSCFHFGTPRRMLYLSIWQKNMKAATGQWLIKLENGGIHAKKLWQFIKSEMNEQVSWFLQWGLMYGIIITQRRDNLRYMHDCEGGGLHGSEWYPMVYSFVKIWNLNRQFWLLIAGWAQHWYANIKANIRLRSINHRIFISTIENQG